MATLTSSYQFLGRSNVMTSVSGSLNYYILLYGKTSANATTGIHKVTIKQVLASTNNATFYYYNMSHSGTVGGESAFSGTNEPRDAWELGSFTAGGVTYKTGTLIGEGSVDVDCTDGSSRNVSLSCTWKFSDSADSYTPANGTSRTVTVTATLAAIPRASEPTVASTGTMRSSVTIYTNRKNSSSTHTLKYTFGGTTATIASGVGASYSWSIPDLASKCNNATSGKATITCITYNGSTVIGTKTCTITLNVPAATNPSFQNGDVIIGAGNPITTSALSTNFTHLVTYLFNGKTGKVNEDKAKSGIVWWPPYDLANAIQDSPTGIGYITCTTYNGTALVGSKTTPFQAVVPDNDITKPQFTADGLVVAPSGSVPSVFSGIYIQGKTGVQASFTATSNYSTIASYELLADGRVYTGNPATSAPLTQSGNIKIYGTVTDARGYSKEQPKTITVYSYSEPSLTDIVCERSLQDKTYDDSGTYLHIKAKRVYAPVIVDGVQKNTCDIKYQYKVEGGEWSNEETLLSGSDQSTDVYEAAIPDKVTDITKSYAVRLIVEDTMGANIPYNYAVPTADVTLHLSEGGYGVSVGKYSAATEDNKMFECAWDAYIDGGLYTKYSDEVYALSDSILEQGTSGIWNYIMYASGFAICWGTYSAVGQFSLTWNDINTFSVVFPQTSYPFEFASRPCEVVQARTNMGGCWAYSEGGDGFGMNSTTTSASYRAARPNAYNTDQTIYYDITVLGRWK